MTAQPAVRTDHAFENGDLRDVLSVMAPLTGVLLTLSL